MIGRTGRPGSLVVFDTNVVEGRFLTPLLRGEPVRDFAALRAGEEPYVPAIMFKSVLEIIQHAKQGTPNFPWMDADLGYPGGLDRGRRILQRMPSLGSVENVFYWFALCEEWCGLNWDEQRLKAERYVRPDESALALESIAVRQQFAAWKGRLRAFCQRIWSTIGAAMEVVTPSPDDNAKSAQLMLDLCMDSLIPNEDLEIVAYAILAKARAFVTSEHKLLTGTALSLAGGHTSLVFVHPDHVLEEAADGFPYSWSSRQTHARGRCR